MKDEFDPLRILAGLRAHGVNYVLVGGVAALAHGSPIDTDDVDVCLPTDDDNLQRLGLALQDLGTDPSSPRSVEDHRVSFRTESGPLDCLELTYEFEGLWTRATEMDLGRGVIARVASIDDLFRLKRESGDLSGAAHVEALMPASSELGQAEANAAGGEEGATGHRTEKIWKVLEDVDTFLTDLTSGELRRKKTRS
jgi:hypothetical protein